MTSLGFKMDYGGHDSQFHNNLVRAAGGGPRERGGRRAQDTRESSVCAPHAAPFAPAHSASCAPRTPPHARRANPGCELSVRRPKLRQHRRLQEGPRGRFFQQHLSCWHRRQTQAERMWRALLHGGSGLQSRQRGRRVSMRSQLCQDRLQQVRRLPHIDFRTRIATCYHRSSSRGPLIRTSISTCLPC